MVVQVCRMWREVSSIEIRKEVKEEFGLGDTKCRKCRKGCEEGDGDLCGVIFYISDNDTI